MSQCRCKEEPPRRDDSDLEDRDFERILAGLKLKPDVEDALRGIDVPVAIVFMRQGGFMGKYAKRVKLQRRPQARMFKADMDNLTLKWLSPRKPSSKTYLPFTVVDTIVPGTRSTFFNDDEKELGIEIISKWRKLRLVCPTVNEWRLWMRGLCYMWEKSEAKRRRGLAFQKADFIRTLWDIGDSDKSGSLLLAEVVQLCKKLQVQLDSRYIELVFRQLDQDKTNVLDYVQFRELVRMLIYSPECNKMFQMYSCAKDQIRSDGIKSFLLDIQKEKEDAANLQLKLLLGFKMFGVQDDTLNEFHWSRLMLSEWNTILDETKVAHCHDMNQPLTNYWIYSADDPFALPRNQYKNSKPIQSLATLLLRGVRFLRVRLVPKPMLDNEVGVLRDIVDKPSADRKPSLVDFYSFMTTVKHSAFLTSSYPLILSLEFIKCSWSQRLWAVKTCKEVCGSQIYCGLDTGKTPTVEMLMKRILVSTSVVENESQIAWSGSESEFIMRHELIRAPSSLFKQPPLSARTSYASDVWKEVNDTSKSFVDKEMSSLVAIRARSLSQDLGRTNRQPMEMYSLTADQIMSADGDIRLCAMNTKTLGHCYVSGPPRLRVSRGFTVALSMGTQFISIPHSLDGMAIIIQQALFWQNGNCGYVAKPRILSQPGFDPFKPERLNSIHQVESVDATIELKISIYEGRQIPRSSMPLIGQPDKLCPYVVVSIRGIPADSVSYQTRPVINNGFAPRWDAPEFTFRVSVPSVSFLCFEVRHYDSGQGSLFLAGAAFVVSTLRQGLRYVPLRDQWARRVPWSGLLVKLSLRPLKYEQPSRPHAVGIALRDKLKLEETPKEGLKRIKTEA